MWFSIAVAVLALIISFLATFVIAQNRNRANLNFAVFAYAIALWMVANYIGANFKFDIFTPFFIHADFMLGALAVMYFWRFSVAVLEQLGKNLQNKYFKKMVDQGRAVTIVAVTSMLLSLSPFAISVQMAVGERATISYGPGYVVYSAIMLALIVLSVVNILYVAKVATNPLRRQVITISQGLIVAAVLLAVSNLVLPQITSSETINLIAGNVSYVGLVALIVATAYAIVRHKLFDISTFVVRAVSYTFSVMLVTLLYLLPAIWLLLMLLDARVSLPLLIGLTLAALCLAFGYQYLRKFFDTLTVRIFYRNYYDPQDVLDRLSTALMHTVDIDALQENSRVIVSETLAVRAVEYWLDQGEHREHKEILDKAFVKYKNRNIITRDEVTGPKAVNELLKSQGIVVCVRLRAAHGVLGYMVLGPRSSGESYAQRDLRLLSTIADEMAITLQNALHYQEIQQFNNTLQQKVNDATQQLRQANERLKVLNETKDDFVSMASHQLRTPLTSIKGYLSMVLEGDMGKITAGQRTMIEQAFTSSQRMAYLISDLLNMSRLRTGRLTVTPGTVSLNKIIDQEIAQLKRMAEGGNVKLVVEEAEDLPSVALDETKIRQVIMNLVDNAIYYTGRGGTVTVRLSQTPKSVELRVIDTGIGVPIADQHKLFTRFYRASNAKKVRPDGTGIGLYMVRKVVTALGGSVIFNSVEGKGSTFGFSFPKVAPKVLPEVTSAEN